MSIFDLFVSKSEGCHRFSKQFYLNGRLVAAGDKRMIWTEVITDVTPTNILSGSIGSEIQAWIDKFPSNGSFERKNLKLPEFAKCNHCKDGQVSRICDECCGSGVIKTHTDFNLYENKCRSCDGTGGPVKGQYGVCEHCDATGIAIDQPENSLPDVVVIDKVAIDPRLLVDFHHDDVEFFVDGEQPGYLWFKFRGCSGLIKGLAI